MVRLQDTVLRTLRSVVTNVYYAYPEHWTKKPVVSFFELKNSVGGRADGEEYLQDVTYQVDMWADTPTENWELQEKVDQAMTELGFSRQFSGDAYETESRLHHRVSQYVGRITVESATIHQ